MKSSVQDAASVQQNARLKKLPSEFNEGLGKRTAIYVPFPQAVPISL